MSSSFLNSIQRENKAKENLQYDDGAFYYFFSAFTLIILVPLGVSLITQLFKNTNKFNINKDSLPTLLGHDVQGFLSKKEKKSKFNKALLYKLLLAIFLVYLYSRLASSSESGKELKGFDPYDILEIPKGTDDQEVIKKAFRKLSIKYHPDRNPDDPNAANKFMLITKAVECFSDPKKLEKCLNGNPDEEGGFSIGIALPSFLLDKENRIPVLVTFFVVILIIIPYFVLSWYSEVSKYDMDGTLVDDKQIFIAHLNENLIVKNCPRTLSTCLEFVPILPVKPTQKQDMLALHSAVNEHIGKVLVEPRVVKPHDLIHAYMMGIPIGASLIEDTLFILQSSPKLLEAMINFALKVPRARVPNGIKAFGLRCAQSLIEFSQLFYQGLWPGDSSLMQLSSIDKATMDSLIKKKKKLPELSQLIKDENREAHLGFLPEDQIKAAAEEIDEFPNLDIKSEIFVEEETDIRVGDIVTVKVTLTRLNKDHKDTDFKYLKSNKFPFNEKEKWYIFVGDERRNIIFMSEVATFGKKTFEKKFLFPADNQGEFGVKVFVRSNGYIGLDYEHEVRFKVSERAEKKKYDIHPEDLALKKEPTFFEQLTMGAKPAENDSDEELEDDAKEEKKEKDIPKDKEKTE